MNIVIAGAGAVGSHLAKMLSQERHDIILMDPDESRLRQVGGSLDVLTRTGSCISINDLINANIKKTDLFICVTHSEEKNITAAILGKRFGAKKTIARIDNQEYLYAKHRAHFIDLGIDYLINPDKIASKEIAGLLHQTGSSNLVDFSGGKLFLYAIKIEEGAPIVGKTLTHLSEISNKQEFRAVAITRNESTIIPNGDYIFTESDLVYVIGSEKALDSIMAHTGKERFDVRDIMILGGSRVGVLTARELGTHHNIKLIERDREKSYRLSNMLNNTLVINGDGRNYALLMEEGLENMDAFISVTGDSEVNILSCMLAKKMGVRKTIAEVENMEYIALAENMGIDVIINKKLITASRIFRFTTSDAVSSVRCLTGTEAEVLEYMVKDGSKITKASLYQLDFPNDAIIGGVIRDDASFIANGYTLIKPGDRVVVFALPSAIAKVSKFFS